MTISEPGSTEAVEARLERERVFRRLFEQSADAMLLLDDELVIACNHAAATLMGFTETSQLLHLHPWDLSPEYQPDGCKSSVRARELLAAALREGSLRFEWVHCRIDRCPIPMEVLLTAIPLNGHAILHVVLRDISDQVKTYQTLEQLVVERTRELEQRRQVAQGMHDILTILNSNRPLAEMLDYLVGHARRLLESDAVAIYQLQGTTGVLGIQASQGLEPDCTATEIPIGGGITGRAIHERRPLAVADTYVFYAQDSNPGDARLARDFARFHAVLALPLLVKDDVYGALTLYYTEAHTFTDDEIRLAASFGDHAALAIENARLRLQAEQAAVAAERNRLARDLHDAVTQTLFSASLIAEVLPRLWERNADEGRRRLDELRQLTRGALAEMRTLLLELRPSALTDVGLGDLLRQLTEAISGRTMIPITLRLEGEHDHQAMLPSDVHVALYRIAQEALNNIARHAGASQARIVLRYQDVPQRVELCISDDGRGFDPHQISSEHLGLRIMRERAQSIGAQLEINSAVGNGTQVAVRWVGGIGIDD